MNDHIPDDPKMIHDTPRTYRAYRQSLYSLFMESRLLEKEVNSYKIHIEMQEKRIKKLMAENDALRADLLLWNEKEVAPLNLDHVEPHQSIGSPQPAFPIDVHVKDSYTKQEVDNLVSAYDKLNQELIASTKNILI